MTNEFSIGSGPDSVPLDDLSLGDTVRCKPDHVYSTNVPSGWVRDDGYVYGELKKTTADTEGDLRVLVDNGPSDWFNEDGIEVETDDGFVEVEP